MNQMSERSQISRYREFRPPPDLAAYVACTWCNVSRGAVGDVAQPVIPDGCADIIVFGDDSPHVAGPAAMIQWVRPPPAGASITAIRFRPGAVRAILRCHAGDLWPWGIELEAVCGRDVRSLLADLAAAASSADGRRRALEVWTRRRL